VLDQELAHERGMPAGAAGEQHRPVGLAQAVGRGAELLQVDLALLQADAVEQRVAHRARLLVDLLQHEVAESALLGLDGIPGDALRRARDRGAREVRDPGRLGRERRDVAVLEEQEVARVRQDRGMSEAT
jgi:hypothetical protein